MNTILIALAGTAAAIALTWFFCLRPMRRAGATAVGCCAAPAQNIDERIRAARVELAQLQSGHHGTGTGLIPPPRYEA